MQGRVRRHGMQKGDVIHRGAEMRKEVTDPFSALAVLFELPFRPDYAAFFALAAAAEGGDRHGFAVQRIERRLVIEGIDLAWATVHEEENDALCLRRKVRRFGRERIAQPICGWC